MLEDQPKRGRGRPKGSRNKPKSPVPAISLGPVAVEQVPEASALGAATEAPSLLDGYRKTAAQLEKALAVEVDAKTIASLSATLNSTRKFIGQLTGELQLTEAKIVRSDAWKNILARVEMIVAKHPEAASELAAYFRSLET